MDRQCIQLEREMEEGPCSSTEFHNLYSSHINYYSEKDKGQVTWQVRRATQGKEVEGPSRTSTKRCAQLSIVPLKHMSAGRNNSTHS